MADATPGIAVEVTELVKRYPRSTINAVDNLSFTVTRGEVFGLLGPNGAGKTTTVGVLTTRVLPTSGSATVSGIDVVADPVRARSTFAVVPQRVNLDRSLTTRNNLIFHAAYHGVPRSERAARADEMLARLGLADKADAAVDTLSGGQSQRLMIARGLMHHPRVLFLDEPTTGLDPQARLFVHDQVRALRDEAVTVVLTTHDMDEAAKLSDRVGIVDHGKLLTVDTPHGLVRSLPGRGAVEASVHPDGIDPERLVSAISALDAVRQVEPVAAGPAGAPADGALRLRVYVDGDPATLVGPVVGALTGCGAAVSDLSLGEPSLEDVFIHLTGRDLR